MRVLNAGGNTWVDVATRRPNALPVVDFAARCSDYSWLWCFAISIASAETGKRVMRRVRQ